MAEEQYAWEKRQQDGTDRQTLRDFLHISLAARKQTS